MPIVQRVCALMVVSTFISCVVLGPRLCRAFSADTQRLSKAYREIASKSNQLKRWPESEQFCKECLIHNSTTGAYELPVFSDGHGSLGAFALLHRNQMAKSIMEECDKLFDQYCSDIQNKVLHDCPPKTREDMPNWILRAPDTSHHISVAILQEHPIFLREKENLEKWRPFSNTELEILSQSMARIQTSTVSESPCLALDSLLWTPDGAMIAGFVDQSSEQSFDKLRQSSRNIARDVLGEVLTTRPKELIHSTVGRITGLPLDGTDDERYMRLLELMLQYNKEILPYAVENIRKRCNGGGFLLEELSLARNVVWMMKEFKEYATWSIVGENN